MDETGQPPELEGGEALMKNRSYTSNNLSGREGGPSPRYVSGIQARAGTWSAFLTLRLLSD